MSSVNKVIIIGNLGNSPELKYMPSGGAVCNISVATSESWKDKDTKEKKGKTEWHRVVAFGRIAEIMGDYLHKGSKVYIEGKLQTRKWQDKSGNDRYTTEIVTSHMTMLSKSSKAEADQKPVEYGNHREDPPNNFQQRQDIDDSDVPF